MGGRERAGELVEGSTVRAQQRAENRELRAGRGERRDEKAVLPYYHDKRERERERGRRQGNDN